MLAQRRALEEVAPICLIAMTRRLTVPDDLHRRNAPCIREQGIETTGSALIKYATMRLGLEHLRHTDVLDVGCGVRFTQTIINRGLPIKSYTGVDADRRVIEFLQGAVDDDRFSFALWNVHNPFTTRDAFTSSDRAPRCP